MQGRQDKLDDFRQEFEKHRGIELALISLGFAPNSDDAAILAQRLSEESLREEILRWAASLVEPVGVEDEGTLHDALDALRAAAAKAVATATTAAEVFDEAEDEQCQKAAASDDAACVSYYKAFGSGRHATMQIQTQTTQDPPPQVQPEPEPALPQADHTAGTSSAVALHGSADWEVKPEELEVLECLGVGTSAEVHRASWHGTLVAVKLLRVDTSGSRWQAPLPAEFERELSILLQLRHPNLVLFMGASTLQNQPLIVSELCEGGTLFHLLHQRPDALFSWPQRHKTALDVARGMSFLHGRRVIHRDLKSLNVLLVSRINGPGDLVIAKISDFGLSRSLPLSSSAYVPAAVPQGKASCYGAAFGFVCSADVVMTAGLGTWQWMAPEVFQHWMAAGSAGQYDEKADVYSFGIVLFELLSRRVPFDDVGLSPDEAVAAVLTGQRPFQGHVPAGCPYALRMTMERCWGHLPASRPGFADILSALSGHTPMLWCPTVYTFG
eukprot:TRINITY_DN23802_c0_g1_i2.p1 TRINITY_DN23802_c0_g1~~TRINITY_DN23802_c0_g1_i2.p1  ORF type:complete len:498 (-),score=122.06 TRINITY_DN23802_c0_g1_i2:21-1514(-)